MNTMHPGLNAIGLSYIHDFSPLFLNLKFDLMPGEALQVLGGNGKGKTTLLKILCGLLAPTRGQIFWKGHSINQCQIHYRSDLIYLGHLLGLKPYLTVYENLLLSAKLKGSFAQPNLLKGLDQMGLKEKVFQLTYQLSAGQRQRLALTRLIIFKCSLWILDEPFNVLCLDGQQLMGQLIKNHLSSGGMMIFTSHHPVNLKQINIKTLVL